jgi:hypothetical protein
MKISLLANSKSPNPGNWALIAGTKALIQETFGLNVEFDIISWDDITFTNSLFGKDFFERVNLSDLFWVVGAVTFNGRDEHVRGGCRLNLSETDLAQIETPMVLGGVSYRYWNNSIYPRKEELTQLLNNLCLKDNCLIGLRNDGTKKWLAELTLVESQNIVEFPDPGLFAMRMPKGINTGRSGLIFSLNNEDSDSRFSAVEERENLIEAMALACLSFWENYDEYVSFAPHSFEDYELFSELITLLPKRLLHQRVSVLPIPPAHESNKFYEYYSNARAVIATRVHSMSPSIGMGIPTLIVSSQDRLINYANKLGIGKYVIEQSKIGKRDGVIAEELIRLLNCGTSVYEEFVMIRKDQRDVASLLLDRVKKMLDVI